MKSLTALTSSCLTCSLVLRSALCLLAGPPCLPGPPLDDPPRLLSPLLLAPLACRDHLLLLASTPCLPGPPACWHPLLALSACSDYMLCLPALKTKRAGTDSIVWHPGMQAYFSTFGENVCKALWFSKRKARWIVATIGYGDHCQYRVATEPGA